MIGVDEALAPSHVPSEIDCRQGRPVGAVVEEVIGDPPQRVARLHQVGRSSLRPSLRLAGAVGVCVWACALEVGARVGAGVFVRRCRVGRRVRRMHELARGRTCVHRRAQRAGRCGQRNGAADRRECEHAHGDACGDVVQDRCAMPAYVAATNAGDDRSDELRAACGPCDPGGHGDDDERVSARRLPRVPESARQRVPHDDDQDHGHGGEGEQRRGHGAEDVEHSSRPGATCREAGRANPSLIHRLDRS